MLLRFQNLYFFGGGEGRCQHSHRLVLVTFGECLAQVWVRTQVKGSLSLLVLDVEICSVSSQQTGNGGGTLLVHALSPQTHQQLGRLKEHEFYGLANEEVEKKKILKYIMQVLM